MKSLRARASAGSSSLGVTRSRLVELLARKLALSTGQAEAAVSTVFGDVPKAIDREFRPDREEHLDFFAGPSTCHESASDSLVDSTEVFERA